MQWYILKPAGVKWFFFFLKRVGWSLLSRRLDSWRSILLPITIKSSSPFRVAFKTLIPICLMLLRWFHNTIRLTFCCKVKKKIREIQIKKTDEQNKIYGFAYPVFRYSIEYRIVPARVRKYPSSHEIGPNGYKETNKKKLWKPHSFGYNAMRRIKYHIGYDVMSFNQKAFLPCWIQWQGCRPYNVHSDNRNNFQSGNRICPREVLRTVQIVHLFFLRILLSYRSLLQRLRR